jgi:hypothetical protein
METTDYKEARKPLAANAAQLAACLKKSAYPGV